MATEFPFNQFKRRFDLQQMELIIGNPIRKPLKHRKTIRVFAIAK